MYVLVELMVLFLGCFFHRGFGSAMKNPSGSGMRMMMVQAIISGPMGSHSQPFLESWIQTGFIKVTDTQWGLMMLNVFT